MSIQKVPVWVYLGLAVVTVQVALLYLFGQPWYCRCGSIKLWEGSVLSVGNSQHIADWYTYSHIIHGVLFYGIVSLLLPRTSFATRFLISLGLEVGWEILENTPLVIEHYRQQALAVGYTGDSILNSVCDVVAMVLGFSIGRFSTLFGASRMWVLVGFVLCLELCVGYTIRDNLTLNVA